MKFTEVLQANQARTSYSCGNNDSAGKLPAGGAIELIGEPAGEPAELTTKIPMGRISGWDVQKTFPGTHC